MSSRELLDNIIKQLKKKEGLDRFYVLFNHAHEDSEDIKEILLGKVSIMPIKLKYPLLSNAFSKDDISCGIKVLKSKFITMSKKDIK